MNVSCNVPPTGLFDDVDDDVDADDDVDDVDDGLSPAFPAPNSASWSTSLPRLCPDLRTLARHCKNVWVTLTIFWSSQLQICN